MEKKKRKTEKKKMKMNINHRCISLTTEKGKKNGEINESASAYNHMFMKPSYTKFMNLITITTRSICFSSHATKNGFYSCLSIIQYIVLF